MTPNSKGIQDLVSKLAVPWEEDVTPERRRYYVNKICGGPGKSGMGIVYLVFDKVLEISFAIKTFQAKFFESPRAINQFKAEAEVWIELGRHRNIVRAYRVEKYNGRPYVFIQWIVGDEQYGNDLSGWIRQGGLNPSTIVNFAIQFCRGMAHAEKQFAKMGKKFVHRDIKPQNIMVTKAKVVKVTDFGIVQALRNEAITSEVIGKEDENYLYKSNQRGISGTPFYMSPEQIRQGQEGLKRLGVLRESDDISDLDIPSDIYSFGCVLYEMVKGRPPFWSFPWNEARYFSQTLYEEPERIDSDDPALNDLIMQCLRKKPAQRGFTSFSQLEEVLQDIYTRLSGSRLSEETAEGIGAWELVDHGYSFINLEMPERAIKDFNRALELHPNLTEVYTHRAVAYNKLGEHRRAIEDCDKALILDNENENAFVNRAIGYNKLGKFEKSMEDIDRAIGLNPGRAESYSNRGNVNSNLGHFQLAIEDFNKALELNPHNEEFFFNRAVAYSHLKKFKNAILDYDRALGFNPRMYQAYGNRGIVYRKLGCPERAIEEFNTALRLNPKDAQDYANRGNAYRDLGKFERAIEDYDRSLELNPKPMTYGARAVAYTNLGNFKRAFDDFEKALEIDPNLAAIYYHQGIAHYKFGQREKAVHSFGRFTELALPHRTRQVTRVRELIHRIESEISKRKDKSRLSSGGLKEADAAFNRGDYKTARKLLLKEAERGHAEARYKLGFMYDRGDGVDQDFETAHKYYKLAAEQDYAMAQNNLGAMYKYGDGVPQDYMEAEKWFKLAAEQGLADAQDNLGCMYRDGHGVPQDFEEAVKWFSLAAEQGDAKAQGNLGLMYVYGRGVPQNYKTAHKYLMLAANKGLATAQYCLGILYIDGNGVDQDIDTAIKWFKLAAENGDDMAKQALAQLRTISDSG